MKAKKGLAFGVHFSQTSLEDAFVELKLTGFSVSDISILFVAPADHSKEGLTWVMDLGVSALLTVGPLVAAGPIAPVLMKARGDEALGKVTKALIELGVDEEQAPEFETCLDKGGFLIFVHVDDARWIRMATGVLEATKTEHLSANYRGNRDYWKRERLEPTSTG